MDTDSDRGCFMSSDDAFGAIFAAIEATPRSFVVESLPAMFHSIKLAPDAPGRPYQVDLLPDLRQLEAFTASHTASPIYGNNVDSPFVHTLCHLSLKAASVQWMGVRTFHVLEDCALIFPLHHHGLITTLPNCKHLKFH